MKKQTLVLLALAALAFALPARSDSAPAYGPAPTATPAAFDDPSIHFVPPPGFVKINAPAPELSDNLTPVAGYIKNAGHQDALLLTISMRDYQGGGTDGWESAAEQDLRAQIDGALVKKTNTTLHNGMPAYFLKVQYGDGFDSMLQFGYAVFDGRRGIYVAIGGHVGSVDENSAKEALKDLAVVVYPRGRL
jgi:hypothetical protein